MRFHNNRDFKQIPRILLIILLFLLILSCDIERREGELYLDTLHSVIETAAALHPDIAKVDSIGTAAGKGSYPIKRIIITGSNLKKSVVTAKPRVLITGAVHGNEQVSAEIAVRLAEYLIEQYQAGNTVITVLLDDCEIHIVPVVNPWGLVNDRVKINEVVTDGRYTAAGIDINRDFGLPDPDPSAPSLSNPDWFHPWYGGFAAKESRILRDLCESERYILSIQGHTGAENINLPMDYLEYVDAGEDGNIDYLDTYIPIYPLMEKFAKNYEASLQSAGLDDFYYIEGGDWYIIAGSFTDWHFGALGAPGYTIEYDTVQDRVSEEYAESVWQEHKDALIDLLGITSNRISGRVTDIDGNSVIALLTFQRSASDSRYLGERTEITLSAHSDEVSGYYHIIIPDGNWEISVNEIGYEPYNITVNHPGDEPDEPTEQNIQLSSSSKY
ncbi:MAG: hypothetical protein KAQ69_08810 [Spirochaetales bacterium]|nr:hypothetical protein [Spirochaetales bacterium]